MMENLKKRLPGILLAILIAIPAWYIGKLVPVIGGPVLGILFGMVLAFWKRPAIFQPGIQFTGKKVLQYAIILIGFEMNLYNILATGSQTLVLMLFTLTAAFLTAYIAGKMLHINGNTTILIGVGSAICGGSAIAATAPVIGAEDDEVAHAISTIFLFNVLAAFLFPAIGHLLQMSDTQFGLWAGTAVNDTSSVVAAGYSYSEVAGNLAVVVKLTRTLFIIPITFALALANARKSKQQAAAQFSLAKIFPWFVLGFLLTAILNTFLPIPEAVTNFLSQAGKFLIIAAMAAIGLNTNIIKLLKNGIRPILLGFLCWVVLAVTSLIAQGILY